MSLTQSLREENFGRSAVTAGALRGDQSPMTYGTADQAPKSEEESL